MAFPAVQTTNNSFNQATSTTITVALPTGIVSGDLLLVKVHFRQAADLTWPAGWTSGAYLNSGGAANSLSIRWRIADGTEGASIDLTSATAVHSAHLSLRITGHDATTPITFGAGVSGGDVNPNSGSVSPAPGSADYLWFSVVGTNANRDVTVSPTDYTDILNRNSGTAASNARVMSVRRSLAAATEDPGAWTLTAAPSNWYAVTIAVHPAPAGGTSGTAAATAPAAATSAAGTPEVTGTGAATAPAATAQGGDSVTGTAAATAPAAGASSTGTSTVTGTGAATAPASTAAGVGYTIPDDAVWTVQTVAMEPLGATGTVAVSAPPAEVVAAGYAYDEVARAIADISAGGWTPSAGSDLYAMLTDDPGAGDASYIRSPATAGPNVCEIRMSPMTPPGSRTVQFRIRHRLAP